MSLIVSSWACCVQCVCYLYIGQAVSSSLLRSVSNCSRLVELVCLERARMWEVSRPVSAVALLLLGLACQPSEADDMNGM